MRLKVKIESCSIPIRMSKPTMNVQKMRAADIASMIVADIEAGNHQVIMTNICNGDMVGHTSNVEATMKVCESVDAALAKIVPVAQAHGFHIMITADHGNAEEMIDEKSGWTFNST